MNKGYTYCHEHLHLDLSRVKKDIDTVFNEKKKIIKELKELKNKGVGNIVEVTNRGMGRDAAFMVEVEKETGINVLASTGYYIHPFFIEEVSNSTKEQLAQIMLDEINIGIDGTEKKAEVIGEIGTSYNEFHPLELKVFEAAIITHKESNKPISTHTSLSTLALEQIALFKKHNIDLTRVTIGHCDLRDNLDTILKIIDSGAYVQFDTIGKNSYYPDEKRIVMLKELKERGLLNRVMLSMDITRRSHLKAAGGLGWSYLIDKFIPELEKNNIDKNDIDMMMVKNPMEFFRGR